MHCNALYSFAAAALLAVSAQAAPAPQGTGVFKREPQGTGVFKRQPQATGVFPRAPQASGNFKRAPQATGIFQRSPQATGIFQRSPQATGVFPREAQASGVFPRAPQATGGFFEKRDESDPPFPQEIFSKDEDSSTTASCSSDGGKHPVYTISIPSDIANSAGFGSAGCPAQGFIDTMHSAGEPLLGYGCEENADGGITITFTGAGPTGSAVDAALTTLSEGQFSQSGLCEQADGSS